MNKEVYIYDNELYCYDCGKDICETTINSENRPVLEFIGESDIPEYCKNCDMPLENDLTQAGIRNVLNALKEAIDTKNNTFTLNEWSHQLHDYNLQGNELEILKNYEIFSKKAKR